MLYITGGGFAKEGGRRMTGGFFHENHPYQTLCLSSSVHNELVNCSVMYGD